MVSYPADTKWAANTIEEPAAGGGESPGVEDLKTALESCRPAGVWCPSTTLTLLAGCGAAEDQALEEFASPASELATATAIGCMPPSPTGTGRAGASGRGDGRGSSFRPLSTPSTISCALAGRAHARRWRFWA
jgi:hypothetical protein